MITSCECSRPVKFFVQNLAFLGNWKMSCNSLKGFFWEKSQNFCQKSKGKKKS